MSYLRRAKTRFVRLRCYIAAVDDTTRSCIWWTTAHFISSAVLSISTTRAATHCDLTTRHNRLPNSVIDRRHHRAASLSTARRPFWCDHHFEQYFVLFKEVITHRWRLFTLLVIDYFALAFHTRFSYSASAPTRGWIRPIQRRGRVNAA